MVSAWQSSATERVTEILFIFLAGRPSQLCMTIHVELDFVFIPVLMTVTEFQDCKNTRSVKGMPIVMTMAHLQGQWKTATSSPP